MAEKTPIITCVKGRYQPQAPNTYVCAPAVALIFSSEGEVEVFSKNRKCNQKITPCFNGFKVIFSFRYFERRNNGRVSHSNLEPPIKYFVNWADGNSDFSKNFWLEIFRRKMPDGIGIKRNLKKDEKTR